MYGDLFIEMECRQYTKAGQAACGDDYQLLTLENENRSLAVLSDGLGSGVKAHMLANMTTTMALHFLRSNLDVAQAAETIMDSLPVCEVRKISYATFSMVDIRLGGVSRIIEMGNPGYIHLRGETEIPARSHQTVVNERWPDREVECSELRMEPGDRLIVCSDGVTQAGLGQPGCKFGWRRSGVLEFAREMIRKSPEISARDLADAIAFQALSISPGKCLDDISCLVIYLRTPRVLRILTGPPYHKENDHDFAARANLGFDHVIICGGTTANILERELHARTEIDLKLVKVSGGLPPPGKMPGVGLVTEGILTLSRVCQALEHDEFETAPLAARAILTRMMEHDRIEFIVGTKVNEAHQDPNLPLELELRRNLIKRISELLETRYRKKISINYF